ncbi:uncharacterized protein MELLADRAFT_95317 [Melampsora larici-populina 98AG31]|uniref:Uncharacterized protein n=1 Tax=Melampsora larici-populina (strain 98AG31 / pathotype 3-4-7) TaxID=747676 RepID=F4RCZ9_MELLP|nr:uncharacterized protein MELLADRAFT_95317 [Melampsora larici-populina 98AG31]EGG09811.1 hypothetical protein MELLADRAFT_95317 [Melampsora larici-populina 98AG31]
MTQTLTKEIVCRILESLCSSTNSQVCDKVADEYDLSTDLTMKFEDRYRMPHKYLLDLISDAEDRLESAKACLLDFDPVGALVILKGLVPDKEIKEQISMTTISHGILNSRKQVRLAQSERNWLKVISSIDYVENLFLRPPPLNRTCSTYQGYRLPKAWCIWAMESYIYLGKYQKAEEMFNEISTKYTLESNERLWLMGQLAYCSGRVEIALSLFKALSIQKDTPMIRALVERTSLVYELLTCLNGCSTDLDYRCEVFIHAQRTFFEWTAGNGYDRAVRSEIIRIFCLKSSPSTYPTLSNAFVPDESAQISSNTPNSSKKFALYGDGLDESLSRMDTLD